MCARAGEVELSPFGRVFGATEKKILGVDIQIPGSDSTRWRMRQVANAVVYRIYGNEVALSPLGMLLLLDEQKIIAIQQKDHAGGKHRCW